MRVVLVATPLLMLPGAGHFIHWIGGISATAEAAAEAFKAGHSVVVIPGGIVTTSLIADLDNARSILFRLLRLSRSHPLVAHRASDPAEGEVRAHIAMRVVEVNSNGRGRFPGGAS